MTKLAAEMPKLNNYDEYAVYTFEKRSPDQKHPDRWEKKKSYAVRQEALQLAKRLGDGLERSDAYRSGQFRMPNLPQNSGVV